MRKCRLKGKLKENGFILPFNKVGFLKDLKIFYPDKDNPFLFYNVVDCSGCWKSGILIEDLEFLND